VALTTIPIPDPALLITVNETSFRNWAVRVGADYVTVWRRDYGGHPDADHYAVNEDEALTLGRRDFAEWLRDRLASL
jgi:hypothetical protein